MNSWLPSLGLNYRAVWRWHFYAGILCLPFVIVLAASGAVYLFKTELEEWYDRPYDNLVFLGEPAPPSAQVQAALAAYPGANIASYELPSSPHSAGRVMLKRDQESLRIYVHPGDLKVLTAFAERDRLMRQVFRLHGELWLDDPGSVLVEFAACWTIVLLLTGLYLWWPRQSRGLAGVLYPRLFSGSRVLWRDLHSAIGFWTSGLLLLLLVTGLPWAKHWGTYFKTIRQLTGTAVTKQDWTVGAERTGSKTSNRNDGMSLAGDSSSHSDHGGGRGRGRRGSSNSNSQPLDFADLDRVVATVRPLSLPAPVKIIPPREKGSSWTVKGDTPNRPKRVELRVDGSTGELRSRQDFRDRHWVDQLVGIGIAFHEGRLFGWPNQLLLLLVALGAMLMSFSAIILWWQRREPGTLGAPARGIPIRLSILFISLLIVLSITLPLFGESLIIVWLSERFILPWFPAAQRWLGLDRPLPVETPPP